jgi:hypothetical protein
MAKKNATQRATESRIACDRPSWHASAGVAHVAPADRGWLAQQVHGVAEIAAAYGLPGRIPANLMISSRCSGDDHGGAERARVGRSTCTSFSK